MEYEAVLPVPFFALAIIFYPFNAIGILSSWIGDGFSYPFSYIPSWTSFDNPKSEKFKFFVPITSSVLIRVSFGGALIPVVSRTLSCLDSAGSDSFFFL